MAKGTKLEWSEIYPGRWLARFGGWKLGVSNYGTDADPAWMADVEYSGIGPQSMPHQRWSCGYRSFKSREAAMRRAEREMPASLLELAAGRTMEPGRDGLGR
jgi:hypothetical protein